MTTNKQEIYSQ